MVPYVVGAMSGLRVLLFLLDVSILGECSCGDAGGVVAVSVRHEYVDGTRGSGIVSIAADVLRMSVVRGMRGFGGVCDMCLWWGGGGGGVLWVSG